MTKKTLSLTTHLTKCRHLGLRVKDAARAEDKGSDKKADGAASSVHGHGVHWVVDVEPEHGVVDQDEGDGGQQPDEQGQLWVHPVAGGGDGHHPCHHPVDRHRQAPLARSSKVEAEPEESHQASSSSREDGVDQDQLQHTHTLGGRYLLLASSVDCKEADEEEQAAQGGEWHAVTRSLKSGSIATKPAEPRSKGDRANKGTNSANQVNNTSPGKVLVANCSKPTLLSPSPMHRDWEDEARHNSRVDQEGLHLSSLGHGA